MSDTLAPTPGPWSAVRTPAGIVLVMSGPVTVAALNGANSEPDAALICAAPDMATAVLAGDLASARAALTDRGLA